MGTVLDHILHRRGRGYSGGGGRLPSPEEALRAEIAAIPSSYPDYDEYTWDLDPITHDPHQLAAVLTAIHEAYTRGEVQGTMQSIFDAQYEIILTETIEIRTRDRDPHRHRPPPPATPTTYEVEGAV